MAAAQAKVDATQKAYDDSVAILNKLIDDKNIIDQQVAQDQSTLSLQQNALDAQTAVVKDKKATLDAAQAAYDNSSIPVYTTVNDTPGLTADIYNYSSDTPYPARTTEHQFCKTITVDSINKDWGGGDIEGCGGDFVMIHYTGYITVPTTDTYQFLAQADDGWYMTIGDTVVNDNWVLKGCGGWWSEGIKLEAGKSYPLDAWFYEYGGGACNQLLFLTTQTWDVVPAQWFSTGITSVITNFKKDESLLPAIQNAQTEYDSVLKAKQDLQTVIDNINLQLASDTSAQQQNAGTIESARLSVQTKQEELSVAQQELQAIPPFTEPAPTPETTKEPTKVPEVPITNPISEPVTPTPTEPSKPELPVNVQTVDPQSLTPTQVEELKTAANEILNNSTQGSPEYNQALTALFVAAQADDIVLDPSLESIPGLAATVAAINFMGNVGSDMSPKVRTQSKKVVVTAVVAVGAAVNAATGAALMATPSAPQATSSGSSGTSYRRRKD